jgi:hypothetical protein
MVGCSAVRMFGPATMAMQLRAMEATSSLRPHTSTRKLSMTEDVRSAVFSITMEK